MNGSGAHAAIESEITRLAGAADFAGLVTLAEEFELELQHTEVPTAVSVGVYKVHLLAYMLTEQLDSARFLWKRIPAELKGGDAELRALWAIGTAMWQKDHAGMMAALSAHAWSPPLVAQLASALLSAQLERSFAALGRAYSSIPAAKLAAKLGVPVSKVEELAAAHSWTADAVTGALKPMQPEPEAQPASGQADQLQRLTEYVAHLEQTVA